MKRTHALRTVIQATAALIALTSTAGALGVETKLAEWRGNRMFEDFSARTQVSPDGKWILRTTVDGEESLLALPGLELDEKVLHAGLAPFERAVFCGAGGFLRLGTANGEHAWFGPGTETLSGAATKIPAEATPLCSADGKSIAHYTSYPPRRELPPPEEIFIGDAKAQTRVALPGVANGAVFSPDARTVYVLARQDDGASSLVSVTVKDHRVQVLARDLDAWPFTGNNLAVSPDGSKVYLAIASLKKPSNAERQVPIADRWMKIAALDTSTRAISLVQNAPKRDQVDVAVSGNQMSWVDIAVTKSVVALPAAGGPTHTVVGGIEAYAPTWSLDGKRLAYVYGDYRLVDWALTQDVGIVDVDANAKAASKPRVFIKGNHEDFPPRWSPNGKWIVWHSHRDPNKDPAYYDAPGTTDDIWIRAAEDVQAKGRPATSGLWETGWVYWSPDSRTILYTTWDRDGAPGVYHVQTTSIDPDTGATLGSQKLEFPAEVKSPQLAVFSPDGREIALEDASGPGERTLWIASRDGKKVRRVASYKGLSYGGIDWMPDGKTLVFGALDGAFMQIYSVPAAGGTPKRLSDGRGNLLLPQVSPDGRWIACSQVETTQTLTSRVLP